jgi:S-formylglutathione hydrolase FrmB
MTTYYAVADVNGPISVRITADSIDHAIDWFRNQTDDFAADARTDAEDDLNFCGADLTEEQFEKSLKSRGLRQVYRNMVGDHCWDLWQA